MKKTVTFDIPDGWIGCNFAEMVIINEKDISQSKRIYGVARLDEDLNTIPVTESELSDYLKMVNEAENRNSENFSKN